MYLHKQVKNIASINTSWYLQCIHFCIGTQKPQRKVTASLIFLVSTFYPVHQGVRRENGEKLKCCEILSLRICIAPKSILQWSLAKQKKPAPGFLLLATLSHTCVMSFRGNSEKQRKKTLWFIPILLCQKWMLQQPGSVMAHKSGQFWWNYKTTRRNVGDNVRIYDSPPPRKCYPVAELANIILSLRSSQTETANVASLSSLLTISTFALPVVSLRETRGRTGEDI